MKKSSLNRIALVALATLAMTSADLAVAEPVDTRRIDDLEKENASMRTRLRRLESENENTNLRTRLQQVEARHSGAPREANPAPPPQRLEASAPDRTLILADMTVKAAPPVFAPRLYSWTGFYVGANIGYGVGNNRTTTSLLENDAASSPLTDFVVAPRGVLGGLQAGYNWQAGRNWLVGFEADIQAANQTDTACTLACSNLNQGGFGQINNKFTTEQTLQYFGTLRGRLGVVSDNVLFYGTGGAAFGHIRQTVTAFQQTIAPIGGGVILETSVAGETRFGWAAGGGIEAALSGNWTLKAEYLYMNLGDMKPNVFNGISPSSPFVATTNSTIRDQIVRVGVNYRIGRDAPLSAYASVSPRDYAPVAPYNWTGIYAGGNAGYGQGVDRLSQPSGLALGAPVSGTADSVVAPKGFAGGVQVGYNLQGGRNWLVGFEADIQGTNQNDKTCTPIFCISATTNPNITAALTAQEQLDWFGTVRGRVGVVNNSILFYATGGAAFGQMRQTFAENFNVGPSSNFTTIATTHNLTGWTAGGGIEAALWGNWTAKAEYLYLDFGSIKTRFDDGSAPGLGFGRVDNVTKVRDHIFRAGVNYRFSGDLAALVNY